jgi:tRNA pseudouridine55 synthase
LSDGCSGVVFVDKPAEMTSFQALGAIKRALGTRRVGHCGTLDRFATGLLVVLTGGYTRLVQLFTGLDKGYRASMVFGTETDTLDPEGSVIAEGPVPALEDIRGVVAGFVGPILQAPPAYSALHVEGRRAHELSRAGTPPRIPPRPVTVHSLELLRYDPPVLEFEVRCSKGTYVRSLARDLGFAVGSRGHLRQLRRLSIGPYRVEEGVSPGAFAPGRDLRSPWEVLRRLDALSCRTVGAEEAEAVRRGRPLEHCLSLPAAEGIPAGGEPKRAAAPVAAGQSLAVFDEGRELLALAERREGRYRYLGVFGEAAR